MANRKKHHEAFAGVDRPGQLQITADVREQLYVYGAACELLDDDYVELELLQCGHGDVTATVDRFDARLLLSASPKPQPAGIVHELPNSEQQQQQQHLATLEAELYSERYQDLPQHTTADDVELGGAVSACTLPDSYPNTDNEIGDGDVDSQGAMHV
jgi:hypothetical protein